MARLHIQRKAPRPASLPTAAAVFAMAAALSHLAAVAHGHALIIKPISRNYWGFIDPSLAPGAREYQSNELTGGGVAGTSQNGALKWPDHVYSRCGEAANKATKKYEQMSSTFKPASYQPGDVVEFHILISTQHYGKNFFRVCPPDFQANKEEQQCINMERADGAADYWYFPPPGYSDSFSKTYTYTPDAGTTNFGGNQVYTVEFKLPSSIPWTGPSIIQWYWVTGNRCTAPPCKADDTSCSTLATLPICGTDSAGFPEEFWNCMDIVLGGAGSSTPPSTAPTPRPTPTPAALPTLPAGPSPGGASTPTEVPALPSSPYGPTTSTPSMPSPTTPPPHPTPTPAASPTLPAVPSLGGASSPTEVPSLPSSPYGPTVTSSTPRPSGPVPMLSTPATPATPSVPPLDVLGSASDKLKKMWRKWERKCVRGKRYASSRWCRRQFKKLSTLTLGESAQAKLQLPGKGGARRRA